MEEKVNSAYEYLYATIQMADWISDDYKKVAEQFKNHEALKELYLCICDGVSIDLLEVMVIEKDVEDLLRKCRKKHLESDFLRKYSDVVERISVITAKTEHEVKNMSSTVKYIADSLPAKKEHVELPEPIIVSVETEEVTEIKSHDAIESEHFRVGVESEKNIQKNITLLEKIKNGFNRYTKNPGRTVVNMLSEGYSDEQINFIFGCVEEGMTPKEIDRFASPKIKVETMKQLKKVVLKEREKNG